MLNQAFLANNNSNIDVNKIIEEEIKISGKAKATDKQFKFSEITGLDVKKAVKSIKTNACGVDDISAFFIKISIEHTADILADIINASFLTNFFPLDGSKQLLNLFQKYPTLLLPVTIAQSVYCLLFQKLPKKLQPAK